MLNEKEVLMMMETGSRDVNFNVLSAKKLGLMFMMMLSGGEERITL